EADLSEFFRENNINPGEDGYLNEEDKLNALLAFVDHHYECPSQEEDALRSEEDVSGDAKWFRDVTNRTKDILTRLRTLFNRASLVILVFVLFATLVIPESLARALLNPLIREFGESLLIITLGAILIIALCVLAVLTIQSITRTIENFVPRLIRAIKDAPSFRNTILCLLGLVVLFRLAVLFWLPLF
ncbi:MAG: hypothetical protein V6Z81_10945, partial [Parvularculales bacterium]